MKLIAKGKAANLLSETTGEVSWQESLKDLDSSVTRILGIIEQFDKTDSSGSGEGLASGTESTDVLKSGKYRYALCWILKSLKCLFIIIRHKSSEFYQNYIFG